MREEKSWSWMEGCHVDTGCTGGSAVAEVKLIVEELGKAVEVVAGGAVGKRVDLRWDRSQYVRVMEGRLG